MIWLCYCFFIKRGRFELEQCIVYMVSWWWLTLLCHYQHPWRVWLQAVNINNTSTCSYGSCRLPLLYKQVCHGLWVELARITRAVRNDKGDLHILFTLIRHHIFTVLLGFVNMVFIFYCLIGTEVAALKYKLIYIYIYIMGNGESGGLTFQTLGLLNPQALL